MKKTFLIRFRTRIILLLSAAILSGMTLPACDFFKKKEAKKDSESVKIEDRQLETEKKVDEILKKIDEIQKTLVNMQESQKHTASDAKPVESEIKKQDTAPSADTHHVPERTERQIESAQHNPKPEPEKKTTEEKPKESPDVIYKKAMDAYKAKSFENSALFFSEIIIYFPENDLVDNSLYWKGESLFGLKKYDEAIEAFKLVAEHHPESEKAAASLLKAGYAFQAMGNKEEATNYFKKTVTTYPFSQQGTVAQSMLEKQE